MTVLSFLWIAATFDASPTVVPQGGVIRLRSESAAMARMDGRKIRLFAQKEGGSLGLMPVPAGEKPGPHQIELLDQNENPVQALTVTVKDAHFRTQNIIIAKELSELKPSPGESETVAEFRNGVSDVRYWAEPMHAPVAGCLTSPFGVKRLHNGKATGDYHGGIDQRVPAGGPIRAIAGGTVKIVRQYNVHGGTVAIDHGQGFESIYLHMSKFAVAEARRFSKGT